MAYFPHSLLPEYHALKAESLPVSKTAAPFQLPISSIAEKDLSAAINPYQDLGSLMATMSALNAQMSLQQLALQRPEQAIISELMLQNEMLQLQVRTLTIEKERLAKDLKNTKEKLKKMASSQEELAEEVSGKKKRFRRIAKDIARDFKCPISTCAKSYGSEGSLHQHIRIKHQSFDIVKWNESIGGSKKLKPTSMTSSSKNNVEPNNSEPVSEKSVKSE